MNNIKNIENKEGMINMARVEIWDGKTAINNVPAETVLANRQDLVNALGDIFLVVDDYGKVTEIQIGATIASNYGMEPGMELQEIADVYMTKKEEEKAAAEQEQITNEQLQEEIAALSYEVMMLQAAQAEAAKAE
jgi:hypothetical protein